MYFRNKYYFLSNMYPCDIEIDLYGNKYRFKCVEAAYHALKAPDRIKEFENLDGFAARKLGKTVERRKDFEEVKVKIMTRLVEQKFSNPELQKLLTSVEGEIVESNQWGDTFWGKSYGKGENHLGVILMDVRDKLLRGESLCNNSSFDL